MKFNLKQKRLIQDLGLTHWQVKSQSPLFCIKRGDIILGLKFPIANIERGLGYAQKIVNVLQLITVSEQTPTKVLQCACEPRAIYEKIRQGCFD